MFAAILNTDVMQSLPKWQMLVSFLNPPEPKAHGEFIGWALSGVVVVVVHNVQTSSPLKLRG